MAEQPTFNQGPGEETACPSCGRYVGAYETCPYCLAGMKSRLSLKLVRRVAILGSLVGLAALYLAARVSDVPAIRVADIAPQHNMALVKIRGTVTEVTTDPSRNGFRIALDDGTGRISLNGFDKLARFAEAFGDRFPAAGDEIEVSGNLALSEKYGTSMFLTTPARLTVLKHTEPEARTLAAIGPADLRKIYWVEGQVTEVRPFPGGHAITLQDATGRCPLSIRAGQLAALPDPGLREAILQPGCKLRLLARVDSYRDELQLQPVRPEEPGHLVSQGIEPLAGDRPPDKAAAIPLADLQDHPVGDLVDIAVTVQDARLVKGAGKALTVSDGSETETLFVPDAVLAELADPGRVTRKGARLAVHARISEYRGARQLVPVSARSLELVEQP